MEIFFLENAYFRRNIILREAKNVTANYSCATFNCSLPASIRRNHWRCSVKKCVLETFAKFSGKHLCPRLWHRCFPVNFAKFSRNPLFIEHLWTTASKLLLSQYLRQCISPKIFVNSYCSSVK